jgi:hypothetical protein
MKFFAVMKLLRYATLRLNKLERLFLEKKLCQV